MFESRKTSCERESLIGYGCLEGSDALAPRTQVWIPLIDWYKETNVGCRRKVIESRKTSGERKGLIGYRCPGGSDA